MKKIILILAFFLISSSSILAQELAHKRLTVSSGGGLSSDGIFTNQVVIGQTAFGESSDGLFIGGGGFFGGADVWMTYVYEDTQLPIEFKLSQNYPNPFNPTTTISYSLPEPSYVVLEIYNILGQKTKTLVSEHQEAGNHTVVWQANDISSGMYFYRIVAGDHTESKKMLLLK
jgi:hypothetical protein